MKQIKNKEKTVSIILISILIIALILLVVCLIEEKNSLFYENKELGDKIYELKNIGEDIAEYNTQQKIDKDIQRLLKKQNYTIEKPLVIYNAYGTNLLSCNVYFKTKEKCKIECTIHTENEEIEDFTNILYNGENYSNEHQQQIIGLVPGYEQELILTAKAENGRIVGTKTINIKVPQVKMTLPIKLESTKGESTRELANGLYALLGYNTEKTNNNDQWTKDTDAIYLYDNFGIIRGIIPVSGDMPDRIEFYNGNIFFNYDGSKIVEMNRLGKIERTYKFDRYLNHHDFVIDKENEKIIFLVDDMGELKTVEDKILIADLKTGNTESIIDMREIIKELYEKLPQDDQDWIHLNSVDVRGTDLIVSSKDLNSIISIENYIEQPKLKYIIGDSEFYQGIYDNNIVYKAKGDIELHSSQHYAKYLENDGETYYITLYNNNNVSMSTRIKWIQLERKIYVGRQ